MYEGSGNGGGEENKAKDAKKNLKEIKLEDENEIVEFSVLIAEEYF